MTSNNLVIATIYIAYIAVGMILSAMNDWKWLLSLLFAAGWIIIEMLDYKNE